jgi:hypothetical protein
MKFGIFEHMDDSGVPQGRHFSNRLSLIEEYDRHGFHAYHLADHHGTPLGLARQACSLQPLRKGRRSPAARRTASSGRGSFRADSRCCSVVLHCHACCGPIIRSPARRCRWPRRYCPSHPHEPARPVGAARCGPQGLLGFAEPACRHRARNRVCFRGIGVIASPWCRRPRGKWLPRQTTRAQSGS